MPQGHRSIKRILGEMIFKCYTVWSELAHSQWLRAHGFSHWWCQQGQHRYSYVSCYVKYRLSKENLTCSKNQLMLKDTHIQGTDSYIGHWFWHLPPSRETCGLYIKKAHYDDCSNIWEKSNPDEIKGISHQGMHSLEKRETGGRNKEHFPGDRDYFNKAKE